MGSMLLRLRSIWGRDVVKKVLTLACRFQDFTGVMRPPETLPVEVEGRDQDKRISCP